LPSANLISCAPITFIQTLLLVDCWNRACIWMERFENTVVVSELRPPRLKKHYSCCRWLPRRQTLLSRSQITMLGIVANCCNFSAVLLLLFSEWLLHCIMSSFICVLKLIDNPYTTEVEYSHFSITPLIPPVSDTCYCSWSIPLQVVPLQA